MGRNITLDNLDAIGVHTKWDRDIIEEVIRQRDEAREGAEGWKQVAESAQADADEARAVVRQLCDELGFTPTERWAKRYPWMVEVE